MHIWLFVFLFVCFFLIKKKLYYCFVESTEGMLKWNRTQTFKPQFSSFACDERSKLGVLANVSKHTPTVCCHCNRCITLCGKSLTGMDSVFLTLTKCINGSDLMYLCDLIRGCLYWTHTAVND